MIKKILLIGAESKIGKSLYVFLNKKNFSVLGTSRKKRPNLIYLNLNWKLNKWPHIPQCDVIICCAAITKLNDCKRKKDLSKRTNIIGLKKIIKKYKKNKNTQIIFFSSIHVFDGKKNFSKKNDKRIPQNDYGKLKKISEDFILNNIGLVVRVSKVVEGLEEIITKWIKILKNGKKIYPFENFNTSLVSMQNILDLVLFLINNNKRGIVHLSGLNEISYYQIASILVKKLNFSKSLITPQKVSDNLIFKLGKHSTLHMSNKIKKNLSIKNSEKTLEVFLKKYLSNNFLK